MFSAPIRSDDKWQGCGAGALGAGELCPEPEPEPEPQGHFTRSRSRPKCERLQITLINDMIVGQQ